jgi:MFS family permease
MVLLLAIPFTTHLAAFLLVVVLAAITVQLGTGVYYILVRELATPGTEGISLSVLTAVGFSGSLIAPVAGGWLIAGYSWTIAFAAIATLGVLGIVALVAVPEPGHEPA